MTRWRLLEKSRATAFTALTAAFLFLGAEARGQSAWLPDAGAWSLSSSYAFQTFDTAWVGRVKTPLPNSFDQHTASLSLEYGVSDRFAADLSLGYTRATFGPGGLSHGLNDTEFGLRWQALDESVAESPLTPSIAFRIGGIVEGSYPTFNGGFPFAPGDGASGFEIAMLLGKSIGDTGLTLYGDIGYGDRFERVPANLLVSAGIAYDLPRHFVANVGYRRFQSLSGLDIGGPGFNPSRFPEIKEVAQSIEAGLGYTDSGGRHFHVFFARTLAGRNTGEQNIVGVSASFGF